MKKLIAILLFTGATTASATFVPGPFQIRQDTVLGATVTFNGAQPVTLTQPTVVGATTTYNGTQIVGIVQPTVLGATVTYNGTQVVGIVQPTVLGATVTFNGSQPILVIGTPTIQGLLSDNGAAATTNRVGGAPGIYQTNYAGGTAGTVGRDSAQDHGTDGLMWTAVLPALRPASYAASTGTITTAATASYIAAVCGNPTNIVLVYGVRVSCTETTAGNVNLAIVKTTSTFVGAYSTMTRVADDSSIDVGVSSAVWFQANPTNPGLGTGNLLNLDTYKLGCMASATASPNDIYISPADWRMKPVVLRGVSQCVAVDLLSTTVTGGSFSATFNWLETTTISP